MSKYVAKRVLDAVDGNAASRDSIDEKTCKARRSSCSCVCGEDRCLELRQQLATIDTNKLGFVSFPELLVVKERSDLALVESRNRRRMLWLANLPAGTGLKLLKGLG